MFPTRLPSHFSSPQIYKQTLSIPISVVVSRTKVARALARAARDVFSITKVARALARVERALPPVLALLRRVESPVVIMTVMTTLLLRRVASPMMMTISLRRVESPVVIMTVMMTILQRVESPMMMTMLLQRVESLIRLLEASPGVIRPASRLSPPNCLSECFCWLIVRTLL